MAQLLRQLAHLWYGETTVAHHVADMTGRPRPVDAEPHSTRKILTVGELPEETVKGLKSVRMDPRHDHLNSLMRD